VVVIWGERGGARRARSEMRLDPVSGSIRVSKFFFRIGSGFCFVGLLTSSHGLWAVVYTILSHICWRVPTDLLI